MFGKSEKQSETDPAVELVPSLRALVEAEGLNAQHLTVGLPEDQQGHIVMEDRHSIFVTDTEKEGLWSVPSLRELFRGNRTPPSMEQYPPEYCPYFFFIEENVLLLFEAKGDVTDQEMEEIYSSLRRRPDGRSLGQAHDFVWQIAAVLLGKHVLSEAEFDAILGRLARSARTWAIRPVSRNYAGYLRENFGADDE